MKIFLYTLILLFLSSEAWSAEKFTFFQSTHTKGRGDTFAASYLSHESGRLNPASLADNSKNSEYEITWVHWDIFVNEGLTDTISSLINLSGEGSNTLASQLDTFEDRFGSRHYAATQFLPMSLRYSNYEVTPFITTRNWTEIRSPSSPVLAFETDTHTGLNFAAGWNVSNSVKLGVALRPTYRLYAEGEFYSTDIIEISTQDDPSFDNNATQRNGFGIPGDVGFIYTGSKLARFGVTWHNVMDASYSENSDGESPPLLRQKFSFGWLWRDQVGSWNFDWSFDLQDIINRYGLNYFRLIHTGVEFGRPIWGGEDNDIGVQTGLAEGYLSGGVFLDLDFIRMDLSRYTVELGEYPGQRPDTRIAFSLLVANDF